VISKYQGATLDVLRLLASESTANVKKIVIVSTQLKVNRGYVPVEVSHVYVSTCTSLILMLLISLGDRPHDWLDLVQWHIAEMSLEIKTWLS